MKNIIKKTAYLLGRSLLALDRAIAHLEYLFIVLLLGGMVSMAFLQVVLRNLRHFGFPWAEELLRHAVLWVGFLGASLATREERHIKIDVLNRLLTPKSQRAVEFLLKLVGLVICGLLSRASLSFVAIERQYEEVITIFNIPVWWLELIFPITFGLIAFRFFLGALKIAFPLEQK